jgi:hypothetical protein
MLKISEIFAERGGIEGFLQYVESPEFAADEKERDEEVRKRLDQARDAADARGKCKRPHA